MENDWLKKLENTAFDLLSEERDGFDDVVIGCPWLRWWIESGGDMPRIKGLLIMQDWWSGPARMNEEVEYLEKHSFRDRTNLNLYESRGWRAAIWERKNWLVTNAVWGLRRKIESASGPLPVRVCKAAFPIWSAVVSKFATNNDFKVVFAHADFRFNRAEEKDLNSYLLEFREWAGRGKDRHAKADGLNFDAVRGRAYFGPHPSQWKKPRYAKLHCVNGPP